MAVVWSGGGDYQLGIETWCAAYTDTTETWSVRVWFWTSKTGTYNKTTTLHISGGFTYDGRVNIGVGSEHKQLLYETHDTWNRLEGQPRTISVSASLSGFHHSIGGVSASFPVSARAIGSALKPRGVYTHATGSKVYLYYTCVSPKERPCTQIKIWYQDRGESDWHLLEDWQAGRGYTYEDQKQYVYETQIPDRGTARRWSVGLYNSVGGDWEATDWLDNDYPAPVNVYAARENDDSDNVVLTWRGVKEVPGSRFEIVNWHTRSFVQSVDWAPGNTYRAVIGYPRYQDGKYSVRQVSPDGAVSSPWADSNIVGAQCEPGAPYDLIPTVTYLPIGQSARLGWKHNSLDGTSQTGFEVQVSRNGGAWVSEKGDGDRAYWDTPVLQDGDTLKWRVRTKGTWGSYGPWSDTLMYESVSKPTIKIMSPSNEGFVTDANFVQYTIACSRHPAVFSILCTVTDMDSGRMIRQKKLRQYSQTGQIIYLADQLPNNARIKLIAGAEAKTVADPVARTGSTHFKAPAAPLLSAAFDLSAYLHHISWKTDIGHEEAALPETQKVILERRTQGEDVWETVAELPKGQESYSDSCAPLHLPVQYRVTAVSDLGTASYSEVCTVDPPRVKRICLNFGYGYRQLFQARYNPGVETAENFTHEKQYIFAGHALPVTVRGPGMTRVRKISGMLFPQKDGPGEVARQLDTLRSMAQYPGTVLLRTHDTPPVWGTVSDVSYTLETWGGYSYSFTHTQTIREDRQ